MNTETLIIIHLMNHPGQTPSQIAAAIGRTANTVKVSLPAMVAAGEVWRDAEAQYFTAEAAGEGDENYLSLCDLAYSASGAQFVEPRRATWQQAQNATDKPGLRDKARIKGNMCVDMARLKDPKPGPDPFCVRGKAS